MTKGQLFSEYFLYEGIKANEDYQGLPLNAIKDLYKEISELYFDFAQRQNPDEADTEDDLVRLVLEKLGFYHSRQKSPSRRGRQEVPDFILFATKNDKNDFVKALTNKKPWGKGICILEGKRWNRLLDRGDNTDPIDPHIPSNQILKYLSSTEVASNGKILWGILTNGKIWRLYYNRFPTRSEGYFETDFAEIFETSSSDLFTPIKSEEEKLELFKLFYLLFRKEAFVPTDWRPHKTFLELALEEGKKWEERVAEDLKNNIFGEVFPRLAEGFISNAKEKEIQIKEDLLGKIYENTLVFLYRLLFLFYAEDRNLLPVSEGGYHEYSLSKLRDEIVKKIDNKELISEKATTYWNNLRELFKIVDKGDSTLKIPPYNGGLFEPVNHPFLEKFSIPDKFLVPAIDMLSRDYSENLPKRINYRDLSVRQLGSIYEGLLEFRLKIANTHLRLKKEKAKELYESTDQESLATIKKGEIYLTNEKSERKATGSYYTPDYIVQYIVNNTIGPLIREKLQEFEDEIKRIKYSSKYKSKTAKWLTVELKKYDLVENILSLKVLDPAMGSGHFLVGAVDYLADRVLELLARYSGKSYFGKEPYESPIIRKLEMIRSEILKKVKEENYSVDESKLDDKNLIKRIILKRCIYGVDLNPLAVELAKVSLWLHTFTVGAPLSFLDHHLRCGNSLIGIWNVSDIIVPSSARYQDFLTAVNNMILIQDLYDLTINETMESAKLYNEFRSKLLPFIKRVNISIAAKYFLAEKPDLVSFLEQKAFDDKYILNQVQMQKYAEATEISEQKHLFNWKLEFPEVWYGIGAEKEDGGFDAVIGNPPYGVKFDDLNKSFLENDFESKTKDSSAYFIEKGMKVSNGLCGMIIPKSISFYAEWQSIRDYIFENASISHIADLGIAFKDVIYEQIILILSNRLETKTFIDVFEPVKTPIDKKINVSFPVDLDFMKQNRIIIFSPMTENEKEILIKIAKNSTLIKDINKSIFGNINLTEVKRILGKPEDEILKESFYTQPKSKRNLIPFIRRDPDLSRYLVKKWFLLEIPSDYGKAIEKMKPRFFIKPLRGKRLIAFYDQEGSFATHHHMISCVIKEDKNYSYEFLVSIINSKIPSFFLEVGIFSRTTETARELNRPYFEKIPIPRIDFNDYKPELLGKLAESYSNNVIRNNTHQFSLPKKLNNKTIHDFLSFLTREMVKMNRIKYLLRLFSESKLEEGSEEKIEALKEISKNQSPLPINSILQKEIAKKSIKEYEDKIRITDNLIDQIVYHLYGLSDEEIKIIEEFFIEK